MSEIVEVAVVGAGMFGSAAARHLSRSGARVLVIGPAEPEDGASASRHAFGAHFDEARITRRLGWDEVWGTLDSRSQERFREIETESGVDFFHECGSLVLMARSIGHRTDGILRQCAAEGIAVERRSEDELCAEFPDLGRLPMVGGVEGLLEREQAGYLNPRRLVRAQLELARRSGAGLLRAAVTSIRKDEAAGLWRLRADGADGTKEIAAERVLIATGAFSNHNGVLPGGLQLALRAFTEPNLLFEIAPDRLDSLRRLPTVVTVDPEDTGDDNMSLYLLPPIRYPDGRWYMRIGPGMQPIVRELCSVEAMVDWYREQRITPAQEAFLTTMADLLVPGLKAESVRSAACIIEKTPSKYPYIGRPGEDGTLTVAIGGNGHGARGSDEIGRLAAREVLGLPWDCPVPRDVFTPLAASHHPQADGSRPDFLKPPFGLC